MFPRQETGEGIRIAPPDIPSGPPLIPQADGIEAADRTEGSGFSGIRFPRPETGNRLKKYHRLAGLQEKNMAEKLAQNAKGRFYIDSNCINCSLCPEIAPDIFVSNHDEGYEYVKNQPRNTAELELVAEVIRLCPAGAVQDRGQ